MDEFNNPNEYIDVTYAEYTNKIEKLRLDTIQSNDVEVKGFAEKRYMEMRAQFLELLSKDLHLQKLYENNNEVNRNE